MVDKVFRAKSSELIDSDKWNGFLGIKHGARYLTTAGISSLYSEIYFLDDVDDEQLNEVPDYVLSDTLQKDIEGSIVACALLLKSSKYLPAECQIGGQLGALEEGEREGAYLKSWEDFGILGQNGQPLYTPEMLNGAKEGNVSPLAFALDVMLQDICEDDGFLSTNWYRTRILYEYFREYPVRLESAYLIGELFKELCLKEAYEGDLAEYYVRMAKDDEGRRKGKNKVMERAEELRQYCVNLFVELCDEMGARLLLAPAEVQAVELQKAAISLRPNDFSRAGKPYRQEWFLRNVIEDRKLEIITAIESAQRTKG